MKCRSVLVQEMVGFEIQYLPGTYLGRPQAAGLGGKSQRTKNIRSATPRGWARAVFEANYLPEAKPIPCEIPCASERFDEICVNCVDE